jgi:hypothetical protein
MQMHCDVKKASLPRIGAPREEVIDQNVQKELEGCHGTIYPINNTNMCHVTDPEI